MATQQIVRTDPTTQIAPKIVNECLQVQKGEQVTIFTWDHTLDYAAPLALEVEKAGGVSLSVLITNQFYWNYLRGVPEDQFSRPAKGMLSLLDKTDASIQLAGPKDPSEYNRIPKERAAKMIDGQQAMGQKFVEKKIRTIFLPIGLVTQERAKNYGFNYENWLRVFNNSIDIDHGKVRGLGERLASKIQHGKSARLTAANGTDLRFSLKGRPVHVRDGILGEDDRQRGTLFETLPAGVLEHAPVEDSAEGLVQFDQPNAVAGKMLQGLTWNFKNGHLSKYNATANLDVFQELYEGAEGDKDTIGGLAIGLNPRAEPIGLGDRIIQGSVSISIGGNAGIGGDNKTVFGSEGTLRRPTLEIDGAKILVDGRIQV